MQFLKLCAELGFPVASDKTYFPRTELEFVGITLDAYRMEAMLPEVKVGKCLSLLREFLNRESCKLRELQALLGYLNFAAWL